MKLYDPLQLILEAQLEISNKMKTARLRTIRVVGWEVTTPSMLKVKNIWKMVCPGYVSQIEPVELKENWFLKSLKAFEIGYM